MNEYEAAAELFQNHREELGFVSRAQCREKDLYTEYKSGSLVAAALCNHCIRKPQTTLYDIAVDENYRRNGYATRLIHRIQRDSPHTKIVAKCPIDLDANEWYDSIGWTLKNVEPGKHKELNVWEYVHSTVDIITTGRVDLTSYAEKYGWLVGTRLDGLVTYETNNMDIQFLDIHWEDPNIEKLFDAVKRHTPKYVVAGDYDGNNYSEINQRADELSDYVDNIIVVPHESGEVSHVPDEYIVGYSTPSGYAETDAPIEEYFNRDVHILGGTMNQITDIIPQLREEIVSIDTNTHHRDATQFGEYWSHTVPQRKKTAQTYQQTKLPYENSVLNMTYKFEELEII